MTAHSATKALLVIYHGAASEVDNGDRNFPAIVTQPFASGMANMTVFFPSGPKSRFSVPQGKQPAGPNGEFYPFWDFSEAS